MNEKFFLLPAQKQRKIINAGFRVFSRNSYKKSPVQEIANEAEISKSLLFFYFRNKKELYLFLWEKAAEITAKYLSEYGCYEQGDLFEMMDRAMAAKLEMMRRYPRMSFFAVRAFYEKDPEISAEIQKSYRRHFEGKVMRTLAAVDPEDFIPGLDLNMMYREMYWASEGYLWEMVQRGELDTEKMEQDFRELLKFWKKIYKKTSDIPDI